MFPCWNKPAMSAPNRGGSRAPRDADDSGYGVSGVLCLLHAYSINRAFFLSNGSGHQLKDVC